METLQEAMARICKGKPDLSGMEPPDFLARGVATRGVATRGVEKTGVVKTGVTPPPCLRGKCAPRCSQKTV